MQDISDSHQCPSHHYADIRQASRWAGPDVVVHGEARCHEHLWRGGFRSTLDAVCLWLSHFNIGVRHISAVDAASERTAHCVTTSETNAHWCLMNMDTFFNAQKSTLGCEYSVTYRCPGPSAAGLIRTHLFASPAHTHTSSCRLRSGRTLSPSCPSSLFVIRRPLCEPPGVARVLANQAKRHRPYWHHRALGRTWMRPEGWL